MLWKFHPRTSTIAAASNEQSGVGDEDYEMEDYDDTEDKTEMANIDDF